MKIAILTLPLHTNYGGILQAYALQTVLQRMGHEVEVLQNISQRAGRSKIIMPLVYGKRIVKKLLIDWHTPVLLEKRIKKDTPIVRQHTDRFIQQYINIRKINSLHDIKQTDYDVIVVGSDQVWRQSYFVTMWRTQMKDAFLDFTKSWNIRRIAYAASFGLDNLNEYSPTEIEECAEAAKMFDAVSVREDSGVGLYKETFGVEATNVLDPTMLLEKEDYIELIEQSNTSVSPGDMLCYILDPTDFKDKVVNKVSVEKGLTPFNVIAQYKDYRLPVKKRIQPPIESWIRGFMDAKFVVTDSFHACVFSIIFGKPFLAIGNADRGMSRFTSLLSTFSLNDRLILSESDLKKHRSHMNTPISQDLSSYKKPSLSFLQDSLS